MTTSEIDTNEQALVPQRLFNPMQNKERKRCPLRKFFAQRAFPDLEELLKDVECFLVSQDEIKGTKAERAVCAFCQKQKKTLYIIKEDFERLSENAVKVLILHELSHIHYPTLSEKECDEFGKTLGSVEGYEELVEYTRKRISTAMK